jgi:hypothetical protein
MKNINLKRHVFWLLYTTFSLVVILNNWDKNPFSFSQPMSMGKYFIWFLYFAFSIYTIYCSMTEHFMKSVRKILVMNWGRQISLDLVIGLILIIFVVYWTTGSSLSAFLWGITFIPFGNLSTLLFFAINYDKLVNVFSTH